MSYRPRWLPRAEPRVKQPKGPWRWHGWRCYNYPSRKFGRIVETIWDGWHWEILVVWEEEKGHSHTWSTADFFLYNWIVTEDGKRVDHTKKGRRP